MNNLGIYGVSNVNLSAPDNEYTKEFLQKIEKHDRIIYDGKGIFPIRVIPRKDDNNPLIEFLHEGDGHIYSGHDPEIIDAGWIDTLISRLTATKEYITRKNLWSTRYKGEHNEEMSKEFDWQHLMDIVPQVGKHIYVKFTVKSNKDSHTEYVMDSPCKVINVDLEKGIVSLFPIRTMFNKVTHSECESKEYTAELIMNKYKYKVNCGIPTREDVEKYIDIIDFNSDFWVYDSIDFRYSYYVSISDKKVNASPNYVKHAYVPIVKIKLDNFDKVIHRDA